MRASLLSSKETVERALAVAHVEQPVFSPPSEPFVLSRVLHPVCRRPVPVLTQSPTENVLALRELELFAADRLPVPLRKADALVRRTLRWSPYYIYALTRIKPQIVHAHFSFSAEPVLFPLKLLRIPLLVSFYGAETKKLIRQRNTLQQLKNIVSQATLVTCLSRHMIDELASAGIVSPKIRLIRLGVNTDLFSGTPKKWEPGQTLEMLSIARLHPEKGLIYLIQALAHLDRSGFSSWRLRIVGRGDEEVTLQKAACDLGLTDRIEFLGTMSPVKVVEELRKSHVMILPSLQETQGVVLQEAQATCTPVIATTVGGITEGVLDGKTGLLCPPQSPEALAASIMELLRTPARFEEMGIAARQFVQEHFSKQVEYQQLEAIYREVLANT